jgi:coenzyme F420-reducing hydrogenase delta subunit/ferredoxin
MAIIEEVEQSPCVKKITAGQLEKVLGRFGHYSATFSSNNGPGRVYQCGAVIAALDGMMLNQGSDFGHDGSRVLCHTELEEHLWVHGCPAGRLVFWINDLETSRPWAQLSARTAWNLARHNRRNSVQSEVTILYNDRISIPLSATERAQARELEINWVPYAGGIRPTTQSGFITYTRASDKIEVELPWDKLILSRCGAWTPKRCGWPAFWASAWPTTTSRGARHLVRPDQVGHNEKIVAGSARKPCDLREALSQGRQAARKVLELIGQARSGELFAPRVVCTVDREKCIGCGLCREICECGGIEAVDGPGGNVPREVDPMACTGGGTCTAACPYHALNLQNSTREQREARVASLARSLKEDEVMGFGCNWGGAAAADHAGLRGMTYDSRFFMITVSCVGQLDPVVMGRAFLEGANGLLLVGCPPEQCHHSYGLDHTWSRVNLIKKLLSLCGLERDRIALAHAELNHPERFIVTVESFMKRMRELGRSSARSRCSKRYAPPMTPCGTRGCAGCWARA